MDALGQQGQLAGIERTVLLERSVLVMETIPCVLAVLLPAIRANSQCPQTLVMNLIPTRAPRLITGSFSPIPEPMATMRPGSLMASDVRQFDGCDGLTVRA